VVPEPATFVENTEVEKDFPLNAILKLVGQFQAISFDQENRYNYTYEEFAEVMKSEKNDNLRRRLFLLNCGRVICIIISNIEHYKWRCTSL
jgi:hypothetical protein